MPRIIIIDENGKHLETTNRTRLPVFEKSKKSSLLGYDLYENDMPMTNPAEIKGLLDIEFSKSKFSVKKNKPVRQT
ncbi:MAG: hypothetical protein IH593_09065 [Bacteroidales bacterium]|nr:hypothetical protein [Bacteroidales bacterium]